MKNATNEILFANIVIKVTNMYPFPVLVTSVVDLKNIKKLNVFKDIHYL